MFLHVGADVVVNLKRIVAILDLRSAFKGDTSRASMIARFGEKAITDIAEGEAKSMVLTDDELILSPISSLTLKKRADLLAPPGALELEL